MEPSEAYMSCSTCHGLGNPNGPCLECNQSSGDWPVTLLVLGPLIGILLLGSGVTALVMLWL